jgi:hypothetical protein
LGAKKLLEEAFTRARSPNLQEETNAALHGAPGD